MTHRFLRRGTFKGLGGVPSEARRGGSSQNHPRLLGLRRFSDIYILYPVDSTVTSVRAEGVGMAEDLLNSPIRVAAKPSNAPP